MTLRKLIILLFCLPLAASAQFDNHWIQPGQPYLKINVAEDAIYRVTYDDLVEAGLPVTAIDPRLVQLFHRGVEQAIIFSHSQVPADATFDPSEYLEFYGKRNDGTLDKDLYSPSTAQPHSFYNLFSDTSAYFLTWNQSAVQGKRMQTFDQINNTGIPAEAAYTNEVLSVYNSEYSGGLTFINTIQQSFFTKGEGWTGPVICIPNCASDHRDFSFTQISNANQAAGVPNVEVLVVGRESMTHQVQLHAGPDAGSLRLVATETFDDFNAKLITEDLQWSDVSPGGQVVLRVTTLGAGSSSDRVSVSYIKVSYPSTFNMAGTNQQVLNLSANASGKSYIELQNAGTGTRLFDITDPGSAIVIGTRSTGGVVSAVVGNTSSPRKILYTSSFKTVAQLQLKVVNFRNLERDASFIIISHQSLRTPAGGYPDPVKAYAAYRASPEGGAYDTLMVMIDEIYDQFNFGETSPRAIREFMRMMVSTSDPQYLFIVGKGRELTAQYFRRAPLPDELPNLVPTGGSPASDMVFTTGLIADNHRPLVPVGRLPATTPAQVAAYLDKIKEAESAPDNSWQKRILHLSGGIQPSELALYRTYVQGFEEIAERKYLGGEVLTLGKHSVSVVEFINVSEEVNEGLNLITFFGHSSSNATDIDIGKVTDPLLDYDNKGKYPIVLVNGCYAGEFFNNGVNFGEDWILTANKGARNFLANSSFGLDGILKLYTDQFYETGFGDSILINKGVGDVQLAVAHKLLDDSSDPTFYTAQVHQMVLLGDPSVKLFFDSAPDFDISDASIVVSAWDGKPIHALTDSLKVTVVASNPGKGSGTPLRVRVVHTLGENVQQQEVVYPGLLQRDTLVLTLRRGQANFYGFNRVQVMLDPLDDVAELNENNNTAVWTRSIAFNGTQNLQPAPFGIINTPTTELLFMDTDMLAAKKNYAVEIDTVDTFDSSYKMALDVEGKVLLRTAVELLPKDSLVYYWRTKPAGVSDALWQTSSFAFIDGGNPGFAQLDFAQQLSNSFHGLTPDPVLEDLTFEETSVSFFVRTFGGSHPSSQIDGSFQVNDAEYYHSPQQFNCRNNTINLVAFDRRTVVPYLGIPFTFQNSLGRSCGREPMLINSFTAAEVETGNGDDLIQYIDNIHQGDSVVLFSMGNAAFSSWPISVKQKLGEFGILESDLDDLQDGEPVIIRGRKGAAPGSATILRSTSSQPETQELLLSDTFTGRNPTGSIRSVVVGPALKWHSVTTRTSHVEASDVNAFDVIGIGTEGEEVMLLPEQEQVVSLDMIDAAQYPFIRLQFRTEDEISLTPSRLDHWIVNFNPAPDGIVVLRDPMSPVVLREGAIFNATFGFVNISSVPFVDSLQTRLTVFNQADRTTESLDVKIKGPAPGDTTQLSFDIQTRSKLGFNDLALRVNNSMIAEQYLQNNLLELTGFLDVRRDQINPFLDVTIDGRYIFNGDLVSANPHISITVTDEDIVLGHLDTTSVAIFLTYPCASANCTPRRINFSSDEIAWTSSSTSARLDVTFEPRDLADGVYELRVQGFDASGNQSGAEPYVVTFEVKSEPSVLYYDAFPNPTTGPVLFSFQAAGAVPPDEMQLRIFTREGREVARFDQDEAPPMHTGINEFYWNGLDANGHRLAAGLYLFQMTVTHSGKGYTNTGRILILN